VIFLHVQHELILPRKDVVGLLSFLQAGPAIAARNQARGKRTHPLVMAQDNYPAISCFDIRNLILFALLLFALPIGIAIHLRAGHGSAENYVQPMREIAAQQSQLVKIMSQKPNAGIIKPALNPAIAQP
jgi:hypothetical protein